MFSGARSRRGYGTSEGVSGRFLGFGGGRGREGVAVGTGTEIGRVRCDWGLGILGFPDSGILLSLTFLPSVFFPFLFFATASLCGWGPSSSHPAGGRYLSFLWQSLHNCTSCTKVIFDSWRRNRSKRSNDIASSIEINTVSLLTMSEKRRSLGIVEKVVKTLVMRPSTVGSRSAVMMSSQFDVSSDTSCSDNVYSLRSHAPDPPRESGG